MRRASLALVVAVALAAPLVAQVQVPGEREAQATLPQGRSPLWATLRQTAIVEDDARGIFLARHPPQVKALVGKSISLQGFLMPLDEQTTGTHFLLSKYTPVCAFCPPGEPNEVVELHTAHPITYSSRMVTVSGRFAIEDDGEKGLFFQMTGADVR
jgi:hypothetical protein